ANDNRSWNCGVEGPTDDPVIERLRNRQGKKHLTLTLMSPGVPLILMGGEGCQTQRGNNNADCQDNEISWRDWDLLKEHADVHRFVSLMCARRTLRSIRHEQDRVSLTAMLKSVKQAWHGVKLNQPDWGDNSHCVAWGGELENEGLMFHLMLN